jgi:hypothetical protein
MLMKSEVGNITEQLIGQTTEQVVEQTTGQLTVTLHMRRRNIQAVPPEPFDGIETSESEQ